MVKKRKKYNIIFEIFLFYLLVAVVVVVVVVAVYNKELDSRILMFIIVTCKMYFI